MVLGKQFWFLATYLLTINLELGTILALHILFMI